MKKVLVIEDEGIIRLNLLYLLNAQGFETIGAENGSVGLSLVREFIPDLIICNLKMPLLNGYELLQKLDQDSTTATIPLLFLTAQLEDEEIIQRSPLRNIRYVYKPFIPSDLLDMIADMLGES